MPQADEDHQDDLRLLEACRGGDQAALGQLLSRHQSRMFGLCYRILRHRETAAESCQDAMVKLIQGLDGYDGRAKFTTWMTRIVINVCLSKLRSEKIRRMASLDAEFGAKGRGGAGRAGGGGGGGGGGGAEGTLSRTIGQTREPSVGERVQEDEERRALEEALGALDPEQRTILLLRDQRGLDYDEIGDVLGIAVGTVKSRLFRARAALREVIERRLGRAIGGDEPEGGKAAGREGR